jgi:hypothetical protein
MLFFCAFIENDSTNRERVIVNLSQSYFEKHNALFKIIRAKTCLEFDAIQV